MSAAPLSDRPHVVVIGGGGTGGAVAHDLALRGMRVTVLERGEITSGTTGRHHGLLHSGGRYAVSDTESAVECIEENRILRRIAPGSFEENDGLFAAITDEDMDYLPLFVDGCRACGIPAEVLTGDEARRREPGLSDAVRAAVQVPDGTMDAMRLPLRFFATAQANGATIRPWTEVVGLTRTDGTVTGVLLRDDLTGEEDELAADLVVNAAGPWAQHVAAFAGVEVPLRCSPGVLVAVRGRLCDMVVNRLHKSGDGDIVLPQRGLSVIGTSSWVVEDPDDLHLPVDHVHTMLREGTRLVPAVADVEVRAAWSAVRPLIGDAGSTTGRELSRTFKCFDHAERDGVEGFVTISGGKATTLRAMAEATADVVCTRLGILATCRTRDTLLLPHTAYRTEIDSRSARSGPAGTSRTPQTAADRTGRRMALSATATAPAHPQPAAAEVASGAGPGGASTPSGAGPGGASTPSGAGPGGASTPSGAGPGGASTPSGAGQGAAAGTTSAAHGAGVPSATELVPRILRVQRWKPGWDRPETVEYDVAVEPGTTVLDALRSVRWHSDPTLMLRHSCCHSSCGTCGVRVNGAEVLGCVTQLDDLPAGPVTVAPLLNAPLVGDLVVDMAPLNDVLAEIGRPLIRVSRASAADLPTPLRLEDCVECGLCVSACPICATDPSYLGPAALGAAWRLVAEPRGADPGSVLDLVDSHEGCWRCHLSFACTEVCPTGADPGEGIMHLRGALTRRQLAGPGRRRERAAAGRG
ncbi:FAD-dependent oxidoreductase [Actinotalea sp. M2MS4P-6]|uniref:FAD-dependent oxidoreductase n=1 Tax=Actinotalea sp. M2MS4P-6 TaxID=2983762 RepID=UPI0021E3C67B|nr:FAD-dependent oxidoreductase [Actinotalea sp. M2MS4P-6]MCV2396511.1 FAD-dependent oxidoreductase [Actinotalea sp. M2MS4P-6]